MSLTHKTRLRTYLADTGGEARSVRHQPAVISEQGDIVLPHAQVLESAVRVKADDGSSPVALQLAFSSGWSSLADSELIADTVVVASDLSLGELYREQHDYDIDYEQGRIRRTATGQIPSGANVYVWYRRYRVFDSGVDYTVDADAGRIERLAGGDLAAGQNVLVDYTPVALPVSDSLLDEAAREADRQIAARVAPEFIHSSDPALSSAATYLALSIISVSLAGSALSARSPSRSSAAWLDWGQRWRDQAETLLVPFAPAVASSRSLKMIRRDT